MVSALQFRSTIHAEHDIFDCNRYSSEEPGILLKRSYEPELIMRYAIQFVEHQSETIVNYGIGK